MSPTKLAKLSVIGARVALRLLASLNEVVYAILVGSGIDNAGTGVVGVCLCQWNTERRQCQDCCRQQTEYCPLHQDLPSTPPNGC